LLHCQDKKNVILFMLNAKFVEYRLFAKKTIPSRSFVSWSDC